MHNGGSVNLAANGTEKLIELTRQRAEYLYRRKKLLCTEAILVSMNEGLDGGLTEEQAIGMASGFSIGLGESGCLCGAVAGGVLALGLFLGNGRVHKQRKKIRASTNHFHDLFKHKHKSTCCRVLSSKFKQDPMAHFEQCACLTGDAAEIAARLILDKRPDLIKNTNPEVPYRNDNPAGGPFKRMINLFQR